MAGFYPEWGVASSASIANSVFLSYKTYFSLYIPSAWAVYCSLGGRKGIRPVKTCRYYGKNHDTVYEDGKSGRKRFASTSKREGGDDDILVKKVHQGGSLDLKFWL